MRLSINEKKTIANMGSVFTDGMKVINELVQNGRRAGATVIEIETSDNEDGTVDILLRDNGKGIDNLGALLKLSESGWSESVQDSDNCYGMGFFSTFYCSKTVAVKSKGMGIEIDSALALDFQDIGEFTPCASAPELGTEILLLSVKLTSDYRELLRRITDLALYSSITIKLNGEELESPRSFASLSLNNRVVETPFGQLILKKPYSLSCSVVLQDMLIHSVSSVYQSRRVNGDFNLLFANSTIRARMPDRDTIIDCDVFNAQFDEWLKAFYKSELKAAKSSMGDDVAFVNAYINEILTYDVAVLNDINYLPGDVFSWFDYPQLRDNFNCRDITLSVTKESAGNLLIMDSKYGYESYPVLSNYLHFAGALRLEKQLDRGHWIYDLIADKDEEFTDSDCQVILDNATTIKCGIDYSDLSTVYAAEKISIVNSRLSEIAIVESGFCPSSEYVCPDTESTFIVNGTETEISNCLMIEKSANLTQEILLQFDSYINGNDEYCDTELELDVESLDIQIATALGSDPAEMLQSVIGNLPPALIEAIKGKKFTLCLNERGFGVDVKLCA